MKEAIIFMIKVWLLLAVTANSILSFFIFILSFLFDKDISTEKIILAYTGANACAIFIPILGTVLIWLVDKLDNE